MRSSNATKATRALAADSVSERTWPACIPDNPVDEVPNVATSPSTWPSTAAHDDADEDREWLGDPRPLARASSAFKTAPAAAIAAA